MSSGTMMIPPPTPKSAPKNPAARPMRTRRTGLLYERGFRPPALGWPSAPREAAILLDVDGTLAPIVARPEEAAVPEETRAALSRLVDALRARRVSQRTAGRGCRASRRRRRRALRRRARPRAGAGRGSSGRSGWRRSPRRSTGPPRTASDSRSLSTTGRRTTWPQPRTLFERVADRALEQGSAASLGAARARDPAPDRRRQGYGGRAAARRERRYDARSMPATTRPTSTRSAVSTAWTWPFASRSRPTRLPTSWPTRPISSSTGRGRSLRLLARL